MNCLIQISKNSIGAAEGLDEGPMWNTFWNSTFAASVPEADRVSQFSESRSTNHRGPVNDHQFSPAKDHQQDAGSLITPDLSASQYVPLVVPDEFSFKLRDMMVAKGKIYRFRSNTSNLKQFYEKVLARTKYTSEFPQKGDGSLDIFGPEITRLSYLDDEGDVVSIESDMDLKEAVSMACGMKAKQLVVYLGEPPSNVNSRSSTPVAWLEGEVLEKGGSALDFLVGLPLAVNVAISASIVVLSFYLIKQISK